MLGRWTLCQIRVPDGGLNLGIKNYEETWDRSCGFPVRHHREHLCFASGTAGGGRDQITRSDRGASLGAVVLELQSRTEKRRLDEDGERQSESEISVRFRLEQR